MVFEMALWPMLICRGAHHGNNPYVLWKSKDGTIFMIVTEGPAAGRCTQLLDTGKVSTLPAQAVVGNSIVGATSGTRVDLDLFPDGEDDGVALYGYKCMEMRHGIVFWNAVMGAWWATYASDAGNQFAPIGVPGKGLYYTSGFDASFMKGLKFIHALVHPQTDRESSSNCTPVDPRLNAGEKGCVVYYGIAVPTNPAPPMEFDEVLVDLAGEEWFADLMDATPP